ncbi:MAG: helix-turn-helix transcriptional regulator [Pseudomonadota bacterium]
MPDRPASDEPDFLTTREVAGLLRVKERKVYDLAAAGEIPHRRLTGKLLFPRAEIRAWIDQARFGSGTGAAAPEAEARPFLLTGSHDPLLDWAVRESGSGLATLLNGSLTGLEIYRMGRACLCGLHVPEANGWNIRTVAERAVPASVLLTWAERARGLIVAEARAGQVQGLADLRGCRIALRQPGAGAAALFERLLDEAGLAAEDFAMIEGHAHTEIDAAAAVATGQADAAIGIEAMARQHHLGFVPLARERFDLLADQRAYFTGPVQALFEFARTPVFAERAAAMGGYGIAELGRVRWLSP